MKKKIIHKAWALLLILVLLCSMSVTAFASESNGYPLAARLVVDGKTTVLNGYTIEGYDYYNLRDFADILSGSEKQFDVTYDRSQKEINLLSGTPYTPVSTERQTGDGTVKIAKTMSTKLCIDGSKVIYTAYTIDGSNYFRICDIMQMFNIYTNYNSSSNSVIVDTTKDYAVDLNRAAKDGYFDFLHGAMVGNAETGQILYSSNADSKVSIASTSKIMTYLLIQEAIDGGQISPDDLVVLSKVAEASSKSDDGVISMQAGQKVKLSELIEGMLVVSSNESATALAEHLSGSEAAFTTLMNARARELGLTSAEFYNPHGLPDYTADVLSAKRQNRMSAKDLFTLSSYVIQQYPEILDVTSQRAVTIDGLNYQGENTNRLMFQMDGIDGLKTGTTNRAGCCLIATTTVKNGDQTARVIAIVLGAEDSMERAEKAGTLLQYAKQYYHQ